MDTDKMSTASSVGAAERRPLLQALVVERRILFACTVLVGLCVFVWITAVCTEQWVHVDGGDGQYLRQTNRYFYYGTTGLWQTCRNVWPPPGRMTSTTTTTETVHALYISRPRTNITTPEKPQKPDLSHVKLFTKCTNYLLQDNSTMKDPAYDIEVANYSRTMVSFAIISLFVMSMGCGFSAYTFINPRYMFKRLASGIHFISTSCALVATQMIHKTIHYFKKNGKVVYPENATHYYGVSWYLAWFVVAVNLFAALAFLWYSRKRKGNKAATDELAMADEPTIIGR